MTAQRGGKEGRQDTDHFEISYKGHRVSKPMPAGTFIVTTFNQRGGGGAAPQAIPGSNDHVTFIKIVINFLLRLHFFSPYLPGAGSSGSSPVKPEIIIDFMCHSES